MSEFKFDVSLNRSRVEQALMWATALSLPGENVPSKKVLQLQARAVKEILAGALLDLSDLQKAIQESQKQPEERNEQLPVSDSE